MNIGFNPTYTQNVRCNNQKNNTQPAFKGAIGEKLLQEISTGSSVETEQVMKSIKGFMGASSEKFVDVVESFSERIKTLRANIEKKNVKTRELYDQSRAIPSETNNAVWEKEKEVRAKYQKRFDEGSLKLAKKDKEVQLAQEEADRLKGLQSVKSISEVGVLMPENAMKLMDEMASKKEIATDSMFEYLMNNGSGEEMFAQAERNKTLMQACKSGLFNIPEVSEYMNKVGVRPTSGLDYVQEEISRALLGNPKGSYLESYSVSQKVKERAMSVLESNLETNPNWWSPTKESVSKELDKTINDAKEFHRNFARGKEYLQKHYPNSKMVVDKKGYDIYDSTVTFVSDSEKEYNPTYNFYQVANNGKNNR